MKLNNCVHKRIGSAVVARNYMLALICRLLVLHGYNEIKDEKSNKHHITIHDTFFQLKGAMWKNQV